MSRKFYVFFGATPYCFPKTTLGEFLAALGSTKTPLLHAQFWLF